MQRLLITIPLLVVMLPGCGNTPTGLTGLGDGTLGSTVLDSDGDGFSDETEINGIPGTDPFDATDNPNNVRDTDGDGCSDYDELNFDGFCNNDPNVAIKTVEDFQKATWLVVAVSDSSRLTATAFAVGPDLLGTNAHVVEEIKRVIGESNGFAAVFQHETGVRRTIRRVWAHPDYDTGSAITTPDVGLLETDSVTPDFLPLSTELPALAVFDDVNLCGFPGSITQGIDFIGISTGDFRPRASCLTGAISAIRPYDPGVPVTPENSRLIQHDISTEPGVSGSAVFNDRGQVIGVHALGFSSQGEQNFAIRSDELIELMDLASSGLVTGTVLADILGATLVDSDGDGFSDDLEINSIPGTDPFDATDNPNNVRDTDGDGCSDYDELNFDGFCDNDPNTQTRTCDVEFFNDEFAYGFDLPTLADLRRFDDDPDFLFNASWLLAMRDVQAGLSTTVSEFADTLSGVDDETKLLSFVTESHESFAASPGTDYIIDMAITLPNGELGYLVVLATDVFCQCSDRSVLYEVVAAKNNRLYIVHANTTESLFTEIADALLTATVMSLCVE